MGFVAVWSTLPASQVLPYTGMLEGLLAGLGVVALTVASHRFGAERGGAAVARGSA